MTADIAQIQGLLRDATLEVTPTSAAKVEDFRAHIAEGTTVYVTFLPRADFAETLLVVQRLKNEGMHPVAHLAARSIADKETLNGMLGALSALDASREVLIIGGGVAHPVGSFDASIGLLESDLFQQHGVEKVGIAGHPEGSPDISTAAIKKALQAKIAYGREHDLELYIATQFCFEVAPIVLWHETLHDWGCDLAVHIGLPGPATIKTLLRFAQLSGIGNSMQFLKKQSANVTKLLMQQTPDGLIVGLAAHKAAHPDCSISHCHLYPFAGFAKTAAWLSSVQSGTLKFNRRGNGFTVCD